MINHWQNITNVGHTLRTKDVIYMGLSDAEYLKSIRKALHLTQVEMAQKLGYSSQEVISAIETGKRNMGKPTKAHLETIEKHEL